MGGKLIVNGRDSYLYFYIAQNLQDLIKDYETPGCSKREIAEHYGISKSSVYRLYAENVHQMCLDLGGKETATKKSILVAASLRVKKLPKYSVQ